MFDKDYDTFPIYLYFFSLQSLKEEGLILETFKLCLDFEFEFSVFTIK